MQLKLIILLFLLIYISPILSQVTWIGTNFNEHHLFIDPTLQSEIIIQIKHQSSSNSSQIVDSLEGRIILSAHSAIAGKGEINIKKEFPLIYISKEAPDLLMYKAMIPANEIMPARYTMNISFLNVFNGKVFYLSEFQEILPNLTAGKSGIIAATLSFEVQGIDEQKTYGMIYPENTVEPMPVLLEGVYTHGFCSDEIARLKNIAIIMWLHKDMLDAKLFAKIYDENGTLLLKRGLELIEILEHGKPVFPSFPNTMAINDPENVSDRVYGAAELTDHILNLVNNQPGIHSIYFVFELEYENQTNDLVKHAIKTNFEVVDAPTGADCQAFLLPIELVDFEIYSQETQVFGFWVVALEVNCEYYEVEKSKDAWNWIPFQKETSKGIEGALRRYEFLDKNPWTGISYYRIKQVDFDGTRSYSRVLAAHIKSGKLSLFPNPISDRLHYTIEDPDQQYELKIFDELGACVFSSTIPDQSNQTREIHLKSLSPGVYFIKHVNTKNYLSQVEKFIKI